jgi:gas vesicle protein
MSDTIYLACIRLEKVNGEFDYDPCVDPDSLDEIKLLACDNLVALQNENIEALDELRDIADVVIVPVTLDVYNELSKQLTELISDVSTKVDSAVSKLKEAYAIMGLEIDEDNTKENMLEDVMTITGGAGKVLNNKFEIVDRADNYVIYEDEDDYDDDYDDYDDDDYEDDDYDDEEDM